MFEWIWIQFNTFLHLSIFRGQYERFDILYYLPVILCSDETDTDSTAFLNSLVLRYLVWFFLNFYMRLGIMSTSPACFISPRRLQSVGKEHTLIAISYSLRYRLHWQIPTTRQSYHTFFVERIIFSGGKLCSVSNCSFERILQIHISHPPTPILSTTISASNNIHHLSNNLQ